MAKAELENKPAIWFQTAENGSQEVTEPSITPDMLKEFKRIYHNESNVKLSDADAYNKAFNLLILFEAINRPIPVEHKAASSALETVYALEPRSPVVHNDTQQLKLF